MTQRGYGPEGTENKDSWSLSKKLTTGTKNNPLTLQARFPRHTVYTVQFNVSLPGAPVGGVDIYARAQATITWTVEGNDVTRRIDIGNGTSISGTADAVRVVVDDATDPALMASFGQSPTQYGVTALVTPGLRADRLEPPILFAGFFIVDNQTMPNGLVIPIPKDAGVISYWASAFESTGAPAPFADIGIPTNGHGVIFQEYCATSDGLGATTFFSIDDMSDLDHWTPISPGANLLIAFNNAPVNKTFIEFAITWGIDG
jgi:hypothetical protein